MVTKSSHYVISITDVEKILPFSKTELRDLKKQISEDDRAKAELNSFIKLLKRHLQENIISISEEKGDETVIIEKFLFSKSSGYMEIIMGEPTIVKLYFHNKEKATKVLHNLKRVFEEIIKDSPLKEMFIENITIDEGFAQEDLTLEKWGRMHNITLRKSIVFTIVVLVIVVFFEGSKEAIEFILVNYLGYSSSILINVLGAILLAFLFEPIKYKAEHYVSKFF